MKEFKKDTSDFHNKVLTWLRNAENSTPERRWREEALEDYEFYGNHQDSAEVLEILADQGRVPAVFNTTKPKVDMLVGMAAEGKWDIVLQPKTVEDEALAELASGVLKHYRDSLKFVDIEVSMFEHTVKSGRSFIYFYIDAQNPFSPVVKAKRLPGESVYIDPESLSLDLSDARYVFIEKWLTEDEIKRYWKDFDFGGAKGSGSSFDKPAFFNEANDKYRFVECWYKDYEKKMWFVDPVTGKETALSKKEFAQYSKQVEEGITVQNEVIQFPPLQGYESWVEVIKYRIFSDNYVLEEGVSPYSIKTFPLVLCGAYKDDSENRWFSVIEQMKDPQRALNTMRRQLLHLLQTLPKGLMVHESGAILNIEEYEERSAEPNFHLEVSKGSLDKIKFIHQPPISPVYQTLDAVYSGAMKESSGIQNELMGVQTTSREPGVSVRARQETGLAVLYILFNNFRQARRKSAEIFFKLLQQYVTEPSVVRITGQKGQQLVQINTQTNPQSEGFNDISAVEFDLVLDDQVFTATMRMAVAQLLTEFSHNNPGSVPLDLIMEYSGMPFTVQQRIREHAAAQQEAAQKQAEAEQRRLDEELKLKQTELLLKEKELEIKKAEALGRLAASNSQKVGAKRKGAK